MFALFACSRSSLFDTAHTPESTEVAALRQSIANWLLLPLEHHKTCEAASQRWGEREKQKRVNTLIGVFLHRQSWLLPVQFSLSHLTVAYSRWNVHLSMFLNSRRLHSTFISFGLILFWKMSSDPGVIIPSRLFYTKLSNCKGHC